MDKPCKIVVTIDDDGIEVKAENWEGITNVMLEHAHMAVVRKFQVLKAQKLGKMHGDKMLAEAAKRKEEADKLLAEELKK